MPTKATLTRSSNAELERGSGISWGAEHVPCRCQADPPACLPACLSMRSSPSDTPCHDAIFCSATPQPQPLPQLSIPCTLPTRPRVFPAPPFPWIHSCEVFGSFFRLNLADMVSSPDIDRVCWLASISCSRNSSTSVRRSRHGMAWQECRFCVSADQWRACVLAGEKQNEEILV